MTRGARLRAVFLFSGLLALVVVLLFKVRVYSKEHLGKVATRFGVGLLDDTDQDSRLSRRLHQGNGSLSKKEGSETMGGDAWGLEEDGKKKHCRHGVYNAQKKICECFDHWATASVTDTIDFFEGVCEQYHCQDDDTCRKVLGIKTATCPVRNWNCYCGWEHAFANFGHGWETPQKEGGGECMGLMYTFSIWASELLENFLQQAWVYFVVAAVVFIPFGRKRTNCDHHRPSIWNVLRRFGGCPSTCTGECVGTYDCCSMDSFFDDYAWSIYILDLLIWCYLFSITLYFVVLTIWSVVLWALVILASIVVLIAAICATCAEGMAGCSCDCCAGGTGGGCADCCFFGAAHGSAAPAGMSDGLFYTTGGPWPYDPFWGYSGYGHVSNETDCDCCGGCCITLCRPLAGLIFLFPVAPENMWGGWIGFWMGTHVSTSNERVYGGGSAFIEFLRMGWRRTADLHENEGWRHQVHDFLTAEGRYGNGNNNNNVPARHQTNGRYQDFPNEQSFRILFEGEDRRGLSISRARAIYIARQFEQDRDSCVASSFDDYKRGECWICRDNKDEWDLWVSCHHLFCRDCSTEMLHRKMPCPLCRVASSTVLRGMKYQAS